MRLAGRDIIDEAIEYFRANVLFRKYDVKGTHRRSGFLIADREPDFTWPALQARQTSC